MKNAKIISQRFPAGVEPGMLSLHGTLLNFSEYFDN